MKRIVLDFFRRGCSACGLGPIVLAGLYLILHLHGELQTLSVIQVCIGIISLSALAFVSGGMNVIYQVEHLPLMVAFLIHGSVLYIGYLVIYLVNDWLEWGMTPIFVFSVIFVAGYLVIWAVIYSVTKRRTQKLNEVWRQKQ